MKRLIPLLCVLTLAGCAGEGLFDRRVGNAAPASSVAPSATPDMPGVTDPMPDTSAVGTGNPFQAGIVNPDEDGGPAAATTPSDGRLGNTVASLGDPGEDGFWLKTPLVSAPTPGRVVYVASGRSVQVELRPLDGAAGGGSEISMAAMRLLDAPLTGLPELVVYGS